MLNKNLYMNVPGRILHNGQKVEITQIWIGSMDEWMSKLWYLYNEVLLNHKKNEVLIQAIDPICMNLEDIMLSELSQTQKIT